MAEALFYVEDAQQDGYIREIVVDCDQSPIDPPNYFDEQNAFIRIDGGSDNQRHGYLFFDTTGVDFTGQTITKIEIGLTAQFNDGSVEADIYDQEFQKSHYGSDEELYHGLDDGVILDSFNPGAFTAYLRDLGADALTRFGVNSKEWFGVGLLPAAPSTAFTFYSQGISAPLWAPSTMYGPGENVSHVNGAGKTIQYKSINGHTSGSDFDTDYGAGHWLQLTPYLKVTYEAAGGARRRAWTT